MNGTDDLPGVQPKSPLLEAEDLFKELKKEDEALAVEREAQLKKIMAEMPSDKQLILDAAISLGTTPERIREDAKLMNLLKLPKYKKHPITHEIIEYFVVDTQKAALYLIDKYSTISIAGTMGSVIWLFNGTHYEPDTGLLHAELTNIIRIFNLQAQRSTISEVIDIIRGSNYHPESPFNYKEGWINCRNGLVKINFDTGEVHGPYQHEPNSMVTYCLPIDYDPNAPTEPVIDVFKQWVLPEDVGTLTQILAQGFLQAQFDKVYKKSYLLQGETNSGKSTYAMEFLGRFCGNKSGVVSHVSLQDITENGFSLAELENKILNVFDDLSTSELSNYGKFKNITGATHHDIQVKHKSSYQGRIYCCHVFTCNIPPKVPEIVSREPAFWNRFEFVNFPYEFEMNTKFCDMTFNNEFMSGALNLVIAAMINIYQNDKLMVRHTGDEVRERWMMSSDPLYQFLEEFDSDTGGAQRDFDKDLFYTEYLDWIDKQVPKVEERRIIKTKEKFSRDLQKYEVFPGKVRVKGEDGKKELVNCYKAMRACPANLLPCRSDLKCADERGRIRVSSIFDKHN